jgi:hypothetical protein
MILNKRYNSEKLQNVSDRYHGARRQRKYNFFFKLRHLLGQFEDRCLSRDVLGTPILQSVRGHMGFLKTNAKAAPLQCQLVDLLTEICCLIVGYYHYDLVTIWSRSYETRLKLPSVLVLVFVSKTHHQPSPTCATILLIRFRCDAYCGFFQVPAPSFSLTRR